MGTMERTNDLTAEHAALRAVARSLVGPRHDADDVVQEGWLEILRSRDGAAAPLAWMRGVVRNVARSRRRAGARSRTAASEPEPTVPSTDELAMRSEASVRLARAIHALPPAEREVLLLRYWDDLPPREIARRLDVDVVRVKNRLFRARRRLRERLEGEGPSRHSWPALVALAGLPRESTLLPVMQLKHKLLVAVGLLVASGVALRAVRSPDAPRVLEPVEEVALAGVEAPPAADLAPGAAPWPERVEVAPEVRDVAAPVERGSPTADALATVAEGSGRVLLSVTDAHTGRELDALSLRGLSDERFFATRAASPVELTLTPDSYELLLQRSGYDPVTLPPFEVHPHGTTNLGARSMRRGTGVVEGRVHVPASLELAACDVELFGPGRNPCERYGGEGRCPHCGYAVDDTHVRIAADEPFAFRRLAAGDYHLLVRAPDDRVLFHDRFTLAPEEARWVDVELASVELELALLGVERAPFLGTWIEEGATYAAPVQVYFLHEGACVGMTEWTPPEAANGAGLPPPAAPPVVSLPGVRPEDELRPPVERPDDRPRNVGHSLWPSVLTPPPHVRSSPLTSTLRAPNVLSVREVPVTTSSVLVSCGPYFENVEVDLQAWKGEPLEVHVTDRCNVPAALLQGQTKCSSCHALPPGVLD